MRRIIRLPGLVLLTLLLLAGPVLAQSTFIFGGQGEPVDLNPAIITDSISSRITRQIYEGLTKYKGATTEVIPALAEKWQVSPDGTVWTFTLRKNVKFHDGTPFDAAAVVWNFEWHRFSAQPQHEMLTKAGRTFEYYGAQFGGFDDKSLITKVEAVNPSTVRFTLKNPQGPFLANLAMFTFDQVSPTAVQKWGLEFSKHPVGTGPYRFVDWKVGQEVTLEANPDYWDKAAAPKIPRVIVRNIKDNSQRLAALKAGEIHGMEGINPDDVKVVREDPNLQLILRPTNTTGYVAFNFHVKEFQDKRVREAFAHAVNKKGIVDALYGGTGIVATQFQPPPLWGYNKDLKDYDYNPQRARDLLKDAGFGQGLKEVTWDDGHKEPLQFWYMPVSRPYYPNPKEIAEAIAADLAKVGITVQLQTTDWTVYLDKSRRGQLAMFMLGWTGDNGDPDNFVCYFFCAIGAPRMGFYANQQLTDVLLEAQKLTDQAKRAELYRKAEQMIHDDAARIFIAHNQPPLAFLKKVKGYVANPTTSEYFNTVYFQQ